MGGGRRGRFLWRRSLENTAPWRTGREGVPPNGSFPSEGTGPRTGAAVGEPGERPAIRPTEAGTRKGPPVILDPHPSYR